MGKTPLYAFLQKQWMCHTDCSFNAQAKKNTGLQYIMPHFQLYLNVLIFVDVCALRLTCPCNWNRCSDTMVMGSSKHLVRRIRQLCSCTRHAKSVSGTWVRPLQVLVRPACMGNSLDTGRESDSDRCWMLAFVNKVITIHREANGEEANSKDKLAKWKG